MSLDRFARLVSLTLFVALAGAALLTSGGAIAAEPQPWQLNLQPAATQKMEMVHSFHDLLLIIITATSLFVLGLLLWVMIRFNRKANPNPSKTSHNTALEVIWTVVPVLILIVIAFPSFRLLYYSDTIPPADMTIKAIGKQWFWTYEYPDHGDFVFDSIMIENPTPEQGPRLLAVDNRVVVPVGKTVRVIVTASDVLHSFAMPAFGLKMDAVPGRLNETWFRAEREGVFYGQCSELCGVRHAFMPIAIEVVSEERFAAWVTEAQAKFARADGSPAVVAEAGGE